MNAKERVDQLIELNEKRKKGKLTLIPFYYHFPKLSKYVPGLFKGGYYCILGGAKDGKSKFTRYTDYYFTLSFSKRTRFKI
jgi:hypothetical protein